MKKQTFHTDSLQTATLIIFLITLAFSSSAQWVQIGGDIDGEAANDLSGNSVSMPDSHIVAIAARGNGGVGSLGGHVRVYEWLNNIWVQRGEDIDAEALGDWFGVSVSMPRPTVLAVGASQNDGNGNNAGHVRVFRWHNSEWIQQGVDIDGEAPGDLSGYSVSMTRGSLIAIGAPFNAGNGNNSGHVRVYGWSGSAWIQLGTDIDGEAAGDESGYSVSIPEYATVAIGARFNDDHGIDAGHVRVYEWSGTDWVQKGKDLDGEASGDLFGSSVSMPDKNTVAIGAPRNDANGADAGHVRVYEWVGSEWVQKGSNIEGEAAGDNFGSSVSMPETYILAIGGEENDGNGLNSGHVRVYEWSGTDWVQVWEDIDGESAGNGSGRAVSMCLGKYVSGQHQDQYLAIGAPENGANGIGSGHVRVFNNSTKTSVNEDYSSSDFSFYPNPARESLVVLSDKAVNNQLQIRDVRGRILLEEFVSSNRQTIDISELNEGLYFLQYNGQSHKLMIAR